VLIPPLFSRGRNLDREQPSDLAMITQQSG
jgi:hypothetical protein